MARDSRWPDDEQDRPRPGAQRGPRMPHWSDRVEALRQLVKRARYLEVDAQVNGDPNHYKLNEAAAIDWAVSQLEAIDDELAEDVALARELVDRAPPRPRVRAG